MKIAYHIILMLFLSSAIAGCESTTGDQANSLLAGNRKDNCCGDERELSCKLTSPELQRRKATVLASMKKQVLERKELENGFSFKFPGNDRMVDELTEFVKSERQCCDFFFFQ